MWQNICSLTAVTKYFKDEQDPLFEENAEKAQDFWQKQVTQMEMDSQH